MIVYITIYVIIGMIYVSYLEWKTPYPKTLNQIGRAFGRLICVTLWPIIFIVRFFFS